eukprot:SAG11_NODE_8213_length_1046_cov_1.247096_1_plen_63_part_00
MCAGILAAAPMLAAIESADVGKPFADSIGCIKGAAGEGEHWAELGKELDSEQDMAAPTSIDG